MIYTTDNMKNILIFIPELINDKMIFRNTLEKELIRQFLHNNKLSMEKEIFKQLDITTYHNETDDVVNNTINTINKNNIGSIILLNNTAKAKVSPLIVWDSYDNCVNNILDETKFTKYYDIVIEISKYENTCGKIYINKIK